MRLYCITAKTFEGSTPYPVVTHTFLGESRQQAEGYVKAHFGTDVFFRDCTKKRRFRNFECRTEFSGGWVEM